MKLLDAATLVHRAYRQPVPGTILSYKGAGVLAHLRRDGVLFIPGSDERKDWLIFNLSTNRVIGSTFGISATSLVGKCDWYRGFARFASRLMAKLGSHPVRFVVGHSLGGTAAQMVALQYGVPAITFSSPRPALSPAPLGSEDLILNIVHERDPVTRFPAAPGSRRLGRTHVIGKGAPSSGRLQHSIPSLLPELRVDIAKGRIAADWPRSAPSSSRRR